MRIVTVVRNVLVAASMLALPVLAVTVPATADTTTGVQQIAVKADTPWGP
jgi:hypothetical protein